MAMAGTAGPTPLSRTGSAGALPLAGMPAEGNRSRAAAAGQAPGKAPGEASMPAAGRRYRGPRSRFWASSSSLNMKETRMR